MGRYPTSRLFSQLSFAVTLCVCPSTQSPISQHHQLFGNNPLAHLSMSAANPFQQLYDEYGKSELRLETSLIVVGMSHERQTIRRADGNFLDIRVSSRATVPTTDTWLQSYHIQSSSWCWTGMWPCYRSGDPNSLFSSID